MEGRLISANTNSESVGVPDMLGSPLFIIGLPRSGSTLWSKVLDQHPDVASLSEMHYLSPWHKDFRHLLRITGDLKYDYNVRKLVDQIFSEPVAVSLSHGLYFWKSIQKLQHLGLDEAIVQRILASEERRLGFIFRVIIEEATRLRDKPRAAVKFPVHPAYMGQIVDWWPEAKLIHISRDPRALAASKANDPGGTLRLTGRYPWLRGLLPHAGMSFATLQYVWTSRIHARMQGHPNYRLFLYEDLLSDPEAVVKCLCEFCGLGFQEAMLDPAAGQASSITGLKARGFDSSRMHGWQTALTPWQSSLIACVTRKSMQRFGYEP